LVLLWEVGLLLIGPGQSDSGYWLVPIEAVKDSEPAEASESGMAAGELRHPGGFRVRDR
jgi:hypothetical protein